jgi:hypothetical protein
MATTIQQPRPLSRRKRFFFSLIIFSILIVSVLFLAEVGLRMKGFHPWTIRRPDFAKIEPPGGLHTRHPTLGYITKPGEYQITLPGPYSFKTTYLANGLRITHPLNTYPEKSKKEIWIFGCSFTQGWTVNDEETYPWLLREKLPDYEVVNFGVDGYSTVQSLIQLQESLAKGTRPALVILSYGSFHDQRNTLTRAWTKLRLTAGAGQAYGRVNLPYARLSKDNRPEILYQPLEYHPALLLRYSTLANLIDDTYNKNLENTYHSLEVTQALIGELSRLCKANGVEFVLAGIVSDPATQAMLEHFNKEGVGTVDISVDLSRKENTNLPYDAHPSAIANKEYARKLEVFLSRK